MPHDSGDPLARPQDAEGLLLQGADPAPRYVAPAARPTAVGVRAADVAAKAGIVPALDRVTALGILAFWEYSVERSLWSDVGVAVGRVPLERGADGSLRRGVATAPGSARVSGDEAARRLRAALVAAVADAVRPAVRVGLLLSGGLDSSALAAAAVEVWGDLDRARDDLRFYHWLPPHGPGERAHAEAVARHLGRPLHVIEDPDVDPFDGTEAYLRGNDMPADGGGMGPHLRVLARLRDDGMEVVLTGDGGDEAVTGEYARPWRRDRALRTAWALGGHVLRSSVVPLARRLVGEGAELRRRTRSRGVPAWLVARLEGQPLPLAFPPARRGLRGGRAERDRGLRGARQTLIVSCQRAAAAAVGLRAELPFLDARVEDLVVSLAAARFSEGRMDKALLRRAFARDLPRETLHRPKDQPLLESWVLSQLRRFGGAWLERHVLGGALERLDLVPAAAARDLVARGAAGDPAARLRAMTVVSLGAWCAARGL